MKRNFMDIVPGLIGATIGGIVGTFAYLWGLDQSLKAGVVPGAFVGLGAGLLSARPSRIRGVICGVAALGLGLYLEWKHFAVGDTFGFFLTHLHQRLPLSLIMLALGTFLGFGWGGDSFKVLPGRSKSVTD